MSIVEKIWLKKRVFLSYSKHESTFEDSTLKSLKSTPTDSKVESFVKYSKLELVLTNSKLEFMAELKFSSLLVEFQFFGLSLLKSTKLKLFSKLVDMYIGYLMSTTRFFGRKTLNIFF
jgi:hypothetical protein